MNIDMMFNRLKKLEKDQDLDRRALGKQINEFMDLFRAEGCELPAPFDEIELHRAKEIVGRVSAWHRDEYGEYTLPQAARALQVSERYLRNAINEGKLRARRMGGGWRIKAREIETAQIS